MRYAIEFVNIDPAENRIIKKWCDTERFDTREDAYIAAQCAIRCSQNIIKRGQIFYRVVYAD